MNLFEFAIVEHPTSDDKKAGKASSLLVKPTCVLAPSQEAAAMLAGREIPTEALPRIAQLEIKIRPF